MIANVTTWNNWKKKTCTWHEIIDFVLLNKTKIWNILKLNNSSAKLYDIIDFLIFGQIKFSKNSKFKPKINGLNKNNDIFKFKPHEDKLFSHK
jgi:hypothetical protein